MNRPKPVQDAVAYLQSISYYGLAEPEFKLDPRDGRYKLIEINTRSVTQTQLVSACGVHVEYLAYLDMIEGNVEPVAPATNGVLWIDEINELHYQLSRIRRGHFNFPEMIEMACEKKVFAGSAIDDPIPIIVGLIRFFQERVTSPRSVDTMMNL
jgi:predicted ATP-grasp superfamily ATP-dependent carboligase